MADGLTATPVLEARDVSKHFGGLRAVDGISLEVQPGEILGIVGPNGAGKTTLFDVITGHTRASAGEVLVDGEPVTDTPVHVRCHRGIARTFQQPTVAGSLSVLENVLVATVFSRARSARSALEEAERYLEVTGLAERAHEVAGTLGVFDRKRLMLASAVATGARVLLLDEPFGGLSLGEIDSTMELIRTSRAAGLAIVCIEHVMRALTSLADRVLVMHHGARLFEGTPTEMLRDEQVIEVYLGERGRAG